MKILLPLLLLLSSQAYAGPRLYVFDCGVLYLDSLAMFNVTAEESPIKEMFVPCYLIEHDKGRLFWDGGLPKNIADAEGHLLRSIGTLSKGYRQRVGIAQAILHRPDVLVLDEPTNGLDPVQIQSIRELIRKLSEDTTIILSTHILQEIEAVCDRVLVMIEGSLVADDPLAELLSSDVVRVSVGANATDVEARLASVPGVLVHWACLHR